MDPFNQPLGPLLGEKTAEQLAKHLGLTTTGHALNYFPRRYIERGELTPITQLPLGEQVTVIARVLTATKRQMRSRRGFLVDVTVSDEAADTCYPARYPWHSSTDGPQKNNSNPAPGRSTAKPPPTAATDPDSQTSRYWMTNTTTPKPI